MVEGAKGRVRRRNIRQKRSIAIDDDRDDQDEKPPQSVKPPQEKSNEEKEDVVNTQDGETYQQQQGEVSVRNGNASLTQRRRAAGTLSFADEEAAEGRATRIKKKRQRFANAEAADVSEQLNLTNITRPGEYTAERLRQLKETNRVNAGDLANLELKGTFRAEELPQSEGVEAEHLESAHKRVDNVIESEHQSVNVSYNNRNTKIFQHAKTVIPSEKEIKAAKQDREKWRFIQNQEEADLIEVDRLEKEAESSDDDDISKTKRMDFGVVEERDLSNMDRYCDLDIDPGRSGILPLKTLTRKSPEILQNSTPRYGRGSTSSEIWNADINRYAKEAIKHMHQSIEEMERSQGDLERQLSQMGEKLQSSMDTCLSAESMLESLSEDYHFLQEMRDYFSSISECLQEKAPIIEELEEQMDNFKNRLSTDVQIRKGIAKKVLFQMIQAGVMYAMSCSNPSGLNAEIVLLEMTKAGEKIQSEEISKLEDREDDFKNSIIENIEASKQALELFSGLSMDYLMQEQPQAFRGMLSEKHEDILQCCRTVFADTDEDFCNLENVKQKLEHFKVRKPESYNQAYVPESLPQLLSPFVRLEVIEWPSLENDHIPLKDMAWYKILFNYGMADGDKYSDEDADSALIGTLVERIVLPKVRISIEEEWEITSLDQTKRLRGIVEELFLYVPDGSEELQDLILSIKGKLHRSLQEVSVPMWPQRIMTKVPYGTAFVAQSLKGMLRLLVNMMQWEGLIETRVLTSLCMEELFSKKLLPSLITMQRAESLCWVTSFILKSTPKRWFSEHRSSLAPLESFVKERILTLEDAESLQKIVIECKSYFVT